MLNVLNFAIPILGAVLLAPVAYSYDLSKYREFRFGARLPVIAKLVHLKITDAKTIHQRPALIQELAWQPDSPQRGESVKSILFSFYNGELFHMVVTYDLDRTEGLMAQDIIEVISKQYGTATRPVAEVMLTTTYVYDDGEKSISEQSEKVIARWEDAQYSFNLFQPYPQSPFGMVLYSKPLETQAQTAIAESIRLDKQEAPQRELARQKQKEIENRTQQGKARQANKPPFRP